MIIWVIGFYLDEPFEMMGWLRCLPRQIKNYEIYNKKFEHCQFFAQLSLIYSNSIVWSEMVSLLKRRAGKPYLLRGRNEVHGIRDQRQTPGWIPFCTYLFPSKRRPKSQNGGRTIFNLIIRFDIKYKETTLALGLASVQNKQKINCNNLEINRKLTFSLPPYFCQITG